MFKYYCKKCRRNHSLQSSIDRNIFNINVLLKTVLTRDLTRLGKTFWQHLEYSKNPYDRRKKYTLKNDLIKVRDEVKKQTQSNIVTYFIDKI